VLGRPSATLLTVTLLVTAFAVHAKPQAPDPSLATVLDRVSQYAETYERTFAAMAMEEHQTQSLQRADGRVRQSRVLVSDFLLIKTGPEWAQVFRDVIEVDGKPIRNRDERLRKLFLEKPRTAIEQAQAIGAESRRHNIGPTRQGNSPLLPMIFVHPRYLQRSRFSLTGNILTFEEVQRPTILGARVAGRPRVDLPTTGTLTIDPATGRILAGEFTATGPPDVTSMSLSVQYSEDETLKLMVPASARERYGVRRLPADDQLFVDSTYTNFRRFEVSVGEQIKVPKSPAGER